MIFCPLSDKQIDGNQTARQPSLELGSKCFPHYPNIFLWKGMSNSFWHRLRVHLGFPRMGRMRTKIRNHKRGQRNAIVHKDFLQFSLNRFFDRILLNVFVPKEGHIIVGIDFHDIGRKINREKLPYRRRRHDKGIVAPWKPSSRKSDKQSHQGIRRHSIPHWKLRK